MTNLYLNWKPINFVLPADVDNEIMEEQAERIATEMWEDIEMTFPDFRLPISKQATREKRLAFYTNGKTRADGTVFGGTDPADFPLLMDKGYWKKYRDKVYPMLVSPWWQELYAMPPVFQFFQKDFISLMSFIEDVE